MTAEDKYKIFDTTPVGDIKFLDYTFRKREIVLGLTALFVGLLCLSLTILLATDALRPEYTGCESAGCLEGGAWIYRNLNRSVNPCDDFYAYSCGGWQEKTMLEPDHSGMSVYHDIWDKNIYRLQTILYVPPKHNTGAEKKLKGLFKSCIDKYEKSKSAGVPFIKKVINKIGGWDVFGTLSGSFDFMTALKSVHVDFWTNALFTFWVDPDPDSPRNGAIEIDLSGLGMYYSYYLRNDTKDIRDAYKRFMRTVAELLCRDGNVTLNTATKDRIDTFINDVFTFELGLANITSQTAPTDDPHIKENRISLDELNDKAGAVDWVQFFSYMFSETGVTGSTKVIVLEKEYLIKLSDYLDKLGDNRNRILNNYLTWRLCQSYVQDLSWEYVHANREFYVAQTGRAAFLGTWNYCFYFTSRKMKDALSAMFVRDHFADESKPKVHEMVGYLKKTLKSRMSKATWMDVKTRTLAKDKLSAVMDKLGYPDFMMKDSELDYIYRDLVIDPKNYFQNLLNIAKFEKSYWNQVLRDGEKRDEWRMSTYTVAAQMYNPWNELMVPAGMLQFPLFDKKLPMYMNFGSMGSILAHELINSIDEVGSYYNKQGTKLDWWTDSTTKGYLKAKKCIQYYYGNMTAGPFMVKGKKASLPINGRRYSRYAVAETGGVRQAFYAYKQWAADNTEERIPVDLKMTKDQAFFVSYAQTNCYVRREYYSYYYAMRGHVPENIRANGALAQLEEFQKAFKCPAKSKMNAEKKCNIF